MHDCAKKFNQKGSSKNPWNKGKLLNWYRARWTKGKMSIGLDKHCMCKFLHPTCTVHCTYYIIYIIYIYTYVLRDVGICTVLI